jgi:hypothetical protein
MKKMLAKHKWFTLVILAILEAGISRIQNPSQMRQGVCETPIKWKTAVCGTTYLSSQQRWEK